MTHTVLVYGTLRPFTNDNIVLVPGKLYDISWFPGIVLGNHSSSDEGESFVTCERITVDDEKLKQLDVYEGYRDGDNIGSLYLRNPIEDDGSPEGQSWIYVYNQSIEGKKLIESGDWERYKHAAEEEDVYAS